MSKKKQILMQLIKDIKKRLKKQRECTDNKYLIDFNRGTVVFFTTFIEIDKTDKSSIIIHADNEWLQIEHLLDNKLGREILNMILKAIDGSGFKLQDILVEK